MSDERESRIQVDEDWKARVQAEKAAMGREQGAASRPKELPPLPPASLAALISNFATQALVALGRIPDPASGKRAVDLDLARYSIDMIEVIQQKTQGNVDAGEKEMLSAALHDLRMAYLDTAKRAGGAGGGKPEPEPGGRIITP